MIIYYIKSLYWNFYLLYGAHDDHIFHFHSSINEKQMGPKHKQELNLQAFEKRIGPNYNP